MTKGKMVFMGDSQMKNLGGSFISLFQQGNCKEDKTKRTDRCGIVSNYFRLPEPRVWVRPNHRLLEGPIAHGLQNPGCNDMKSTWGLYRCGAPAVHSSVSLELLGVEFARDVEMQNALFNSTQESTIHYLVNSTDRVSVVVVNTGLHDALVVPKLCPDLETRELPPGTSLREFVRPWVDLYEGNLRWYLTLMRQQLPGVPILLLTTSLMRASEAKHRRTNAMIRDMNARAAAVAGGLGIESVDVQPLLDSGRANLLYTDNVHAGAQKYAYDSAVRDLVVLRLGLLAERVRARDAPGAPAARLIGAMGRGPVGRSA